MEIKQQTPEQSMGQWRKQKIQILKILKKMKMEIQHIKTAEKSSSKGKFIAINVYIRNKEKSHIT